MLCSHLPSFLFIFGGEHVSETTVHLARESFTMLWFRAYLLPIQHVTVARNMDIYGKMLRSQPVCPVTY